MKIKGEVVLFLSLGAIITAAVAFAMTEGYNNGYNKAKSEAQAGALAQAEAYADSLRELGVHLSILQDSLNARSDSIITRWRTVRDSTIVHLTDTVWVREALETCSDAVDACEEGRLLAISRVAVADQRADSLTQALASTKAAWQTEMRQRRGFLHSVKTGLPYLAAGIVAGLVIPH